MFYLGDNYKDRFVLPDPNEATAEFSMEDLADDMEGLTPQYPRIKIVSGGANQFDVGTDPENPQLERYLDGVFLFQHPSNAYWQGGNEDEGNAPICQSFDGKIGFGEPGGACISCVNNQFGSAVKDGKPAKGKLCKNTVMLYIQFSGEPIPYVIYLPPTSLGAFRKFCNDTFLVRQRAMFGSLARIGLTKRVDGPNIYSVATFKLLRHFCGDELAEIKQYANPFREKAKAAIQDQAALYSSEKKAPELAETTEKPKVLEAASDADYIVPHGNARVPQPAMMEDDFVEIVGDDEFQISA